MSCPYFEEGKRNLCGAFQGLFHPSIYEEQRFCRGEFQECGIYQKYRQTDSKVSREQYLNEIYQGQFQQS
ncbi:hypothetical protein GWO43_01845 [candidate division KSB1 bacterium]|nr:hypothetical protein [candidate division KSB1 bacterium]NIT69657.1 hypothetical protein [candidate division KSB1 bacterium]NIU90549.1 hypothetical protein [candidate division KSB1 bacterium]NIW67688.1 hypothetical protein [candidate division KSB1 bacterium]NIX69338.1 hypothetical protein [candidate division KSB1 bacterium]